MYKNNAVETREKIDNLKKQVQYLNEINRISNEKISELTKQLEPERQDWLELAKKNRAGKTEFIRDNKTN